MTHMCVNCVANMDIGTKIVLKPNNKIASVISADSVTSQLTSFLHTLYKCCCLHVTRYYIVPHMFQNERFEEVWNRGTLKVE